MARMDGMVTVDGWENAPAFPATWDDDKRWNGWLMPRFSMTTVEAIVEWMSENIDPVAHIGTFTTQDDETAEIIDTPCVIVEDYSAEDERGVWPLVPDSDGLVTLFDGNWTWCRA